MQHFPSSAPTTECKSSSRIQIIISPPCADEGSYGIHICLYEQGRKNNALYGAQVLLSTTMPEAWRGTKHFKFITWWFGHSITHLAWLNMGGLNSVRCFHFHEQPDLTVLLFLKCTFINQGLDLEVWLRGAHLHLDKVCGACVVKKPSFSWLRKVLISIEIYGA